MSLDLTPHQAGQWISPGGIVAPILSWLGFFPVFVGLIAAAAATFFYITSALDTEVMKEWRARRRRARDQRRAKHKLMRVAKIKAEERAILAELALLQPTPMVKIAETAARAPAVPSSTNLHDEKHVREDPDTGDIRQLVEHA